MKFASGDTVIVILRDPREKLLGVLSSIDPAGVTLRGIELSYFEDWIRSIIDEEPYLPMNDLFIPMWRIERISRDEPNGEIPSMAEQFESRTKRSLNEF